MDDYRRRPPMDGFRLPGSLGGEGFDDDEVEGHIMTDQTEDTRKLDEDTEGHGPFRPKASDDDDAEGHGPFRPKASEDDDAEGHGPFRPKASDDDDAEGHGPFRPKASDDDDTEGHLSKLA